MLVNQDTKISVIVPIYNVEKYVEECIHSILGQTYKNLEIILIDDGTTDSSGILCEQLEKKDARVILIRTTNKGVSAARNIGIKKASGKFILFVDSDDYLLKNSIENMAASSREVDLVVGAIIYRNDYKVFKRNQFFLNNQLKDETTEVLLIEEYLHCMSKNMTDPYFGAPYCKLFKASIIKDNGIYFEEGVAFAEDFCFNLKYLQYAERIGKVDLPVYVYRKNLCGSLSRVKYDYHYMTNRWKLLCHEYGKLYMKNSIEDCYEHVVKRAYRYVLNSLVGRERIERQEKILREFASVNLCLNCKENHKILNKEFSLLRSVKLWLLFYNLKCISENTLRIFYRIIQKSVYTLRKG